MRHHRFYQPSLSFENSKIIISDVRLMQQWRRVLRYSIGDELVLFGDGQEHVCEITHLDKRAVSLRQLATSPSVVPQKRFILAWSLLKRTNNELILQKATELGISELQPIEADRSEKHNVTNTQAERWQRIVIEASEQCGRGDVPIIHEPIGSSGFISKQHSHLIVAEKSADDMPQRQSDDVSRDTVLIGPEGGWSDDELALFRQHHVPVIELGDFTLRAETAAIISASYLLK